MNADYLNFSTSPASGVLVAEAVFYVAMAIVAAGYTLQALGRYRATRADVRLRAGRALHPASLRAAQALAEVPDVWLPEPRVGDRESGAAAGAEFDDTVALAEYSNYPTGSVKA